MKVIDFTVNQLKVDENRFDISCFDSVVGESTDPITIRSATDEGALEIIKIHKYKVWKVGGRFVCFYFLQGDKYPYPPKVMDSELREIRNPRSAEQIEMKEQFFTLVDCREQRIYISDQRKRSFFRGWFKEKTEKEAIMKSILREEDFLSNLNNIRRISLTFVPNLFSSANTLSAALLDDINGFGAEKAKLEFEYRRTGITERGVLEKVRSLIRNKHAFEELVVIGEDDGHLERVFNLNEVISKIKIEVIEDERSKLLDSDTVFSILVNRVKNL